MSAADPDLPADAAGAAALAALLFETRAAGVAFMDRELRYVRVNASLAAMNGLSAEAHAGRALRDVIPAAAADLVEPMLRGVLATGRPAVDLPMTLATPRGSRHFLSSYHALPGADGAPAGLAAVVLEHSPDAAAVRATLRESEAELMAREAQLLAVLRHLPVGVIIAEAPSGRLLESNAEAEAIWGHPPVPATDVAEYREYAGFHPADGRPLAPEEWPLARAVRHGETVLGELIDFRRGDGTRGTMRASASPIRDAAGRVAAAVVVFEDISAQRAAAAAEREARETAERALARLTLLQSLTAALAGARSVTEVADVVVAEAVAVAAATSGAFVLRDPGTDDAVLVRQSGVPAEQRARFARFPVSSPTPAAHCLRTGEPVWVSGAGDDTPSRRFPELADVWAAGGVRAITSTPLSAAGETVGAISFAWDRPHDAGPGEREFFLALGRQAAQAVERARLFDAEREARERAERLQALTEALAAARTLDEVETVVVTDMVGAIGARTGALACRAPDGEPALVLLRQEGFPGPLAARVQRQPFTMRSPLIDCFRAGAPIWMERRDGPDGLDAHYPITAAVWAELGLGAGAFVPLVAAGETVGTISFGFEGPRRFTPSERAFLLALGRQAALAVERARLFDAERAARAEAEAANRAKSDFLAVMSHELRTPLNAIGGYAELMEMGIRGAVTDEQRADLARIQASQRHLLGLINEVLNYARLETGMVRYELVALCVADALAAAEGLIAPQARAKGLALRVGGAARDLAVRADDDKLRQVLVNLLGNAVKFTDRGGAVDVAAERRGARVCVAVRDTGIGIPPDKLAAIFEPFVQVRADLTRPHEGAGLGLAISRDLARGMGGELTVESTVGAGSTFTLDLPAA